MAVEVGTAYVSIVPSAKGFVSTLQKDIGGGLGGAGTAAGKQYGSGLTSSVKSAVSALGGVALATGAISFLKSSIAEARESQKIAAITGNVIKSTGGAAKVTAAQVSDLANAISLKTGIDDEAIQSASNLLLTFTNLRNETGKGNDVFNQATQAATDMGAALGGDPKSSAIQLGKALNDPVKGITALTRVGVSFTEQQKAQVAAMVKSGNILGAQKVILGEVSKEFGGTAAAAATSGEKMSVAFGNFKETIGTALLPVLDAAEVGIASLLGFLSQNVGPALSAVGAFLSPLIDSVKLFIGAFTGGGADVNVPFMNSIIDLGAQTRGVFDRLGPAVSGFVDSFKGAVSQLADGFQRIMPVVGGMISGIVKVITPLLPRIAIIFGGIVSVISGVMQIVGRVVSLAVTAIVWVWQTFGGTILALLATVFSAIIGVVEPAINFVRAIITTVLALLAGNWSGAWAGLLSVLSAAWSLIASIVTGALSIVWGVIKAALGVIAGLFVAIFGGIVRTVVGAMGSFLSAVNGAIAGVIAFVRGIPGRVTSALSSLAGLLISKGSALIGGLLSGIKGAVGGLWSFLSGIPGTIVSQLGGLGSTLISAGSDLISGLISGIRGQGGALLGFLMQFIKDHVPAPVLALLGIHSPSTVFMKIGEAIPQGLALGIASGAGTVQAAANAMMPTVGGLGGGGSTTAFTRAGTAAGLSGGGPLIAVYPQAGQSEEEIASIAAGKLMFRMASA